MAGSKPAALPLGDAPVLGVTKCLKFALRAMLQWQGRLDSNQRMAGSKPAALPLGDAPVTYSSLLHSLLEQFFELAMQHRNVTTLGYKARQSCWKLAGDFISIDLVWEAPKHTSSSAG
jgi:hypothetical protein